MENHLNVVDAIAATHPSFGCTPQAMAMTRDPMTLARLPDIDGVQFPAAFTHIPVGVRLLDKLRFWRKRRWLVKPYRSAGGTKIHLWDGQSPPGEGRFLQHFIDGTPMAAAFHSDGWSCRLLGVTRQIIGDETLGGGGYRYLGSVGPINLNETQREAMRQLGVMLTQRFDLRGLFGVDFIRDKSGVAWPIEINPRYTASMEVIERTGGPLMLAGMKRNRAERAADDARRADIDGKPQGAVLAKGFVFAQRDGKAPDLYELFDRRAVADVPEIGEPVLAGQPVCTLFAWGDDDSQAVARLHEAAGRLYTRLHA
jgi:predicted ATP-grasp superfamily ATP-dependent carboligase